MVKIYLLSALLFLFIIACDPSNEVSNNTTEDFNYYSNQLILKEKKMNTDVDIQSTIPTMITQIPRPTIELPLITPIHSLSTSPTIALPNETAIVSINNTPKAIYPTSVTTQVPTSIPTLVPTSIPTLVPTSIPTLVPTSIPTLVPTSEKLSEYPTAQCIDGTFIYFLNPWAQGICQNNGGISSYLDNPNEVSSDTSTPQPPTPTPTPTGRG
jgi:hypothetical protein